jgi:hypothetical protein
VILGAALVGARIWQQTQVTGGHWLRLADYYPLRSDGLVAATEQQLAQMLGVLVVAFGLLPLVLGDGLARRLHRPLADQPQCCTIRTGWMTLGYWLWWCGFALVAAAWFWPIAVQTTGWTAAPPLVIFGKLAAATPTAQQLAWLGLALTAVACATLGIYLWALHKAARAEQPSARSLDCWFVGLACGLVGLLLAVVLLSHVVMWVAGHSRLWSVEGLLPARWPALAGSLALALSAATAWAAAAARDAGRTGWVRLGLVATLLLAAGYLGGRSYQWSAAYRAGLSLQHASGMVFETPDLYYLRAVRRQLRQHARRLEAQIISQPQTLAAADKRRLELVDRLQSEMVTWTEQQVARWLTEDQQRRAAIALVAYQIQPVESLRAEAEAQSASEQRRLGLAARGLRQMLQRHAQLQSHAEQEGQQSDASNSVTSQTLSRLAAELLGEAPAALQQWIEVALINDQDKPVMGDPMTLIERRVEQIEQRQAFADAFVQPLFAESDPQGLNTTYGWLNLPRCVPGGLNWLYSWLVAISLHCLLVLGGIAALAWPLLGRWDVIGDPRLLTMLRLWTAIAGLGLVTGLLYGA